MVKPLKRIFLTLLISLCINALLSTATSYANDPIPISPPKQTEEVLHDSRTSRPQATPTQTRKEQSIREDIEEMIMANLCAIL